MGSQSCFNGESKITALKHIEFIYYYLAFIYAFGIEVLMHKL